MGLFDNWPYVNFHEINLDYVVKIANEAKDRLDGYDEDVAEIAASKVAAENAATAANNSKTAAATSAANAATSANAAAASATAAANSATAANNSKNSAASSASNAAGSAANAAGSATAAANSATAAAGSVTDAAGYADNANNSAIAAADSATAAAGSATNAGDSATAAAGSATAAAGSATDASGSATAAAASAESAANAAINEFSLGACFSVSVSVNATVKAARTVTLADGTTETVNLPGLIAFRAPYADGITGTLKSKYNYRANTANFTYLPSYGGSSTDRSIIFVPVQPLVAYDVSGGQKYQIHFMRAYDLDAGAWVADGRTFSNIRLIATNGSYNGTAAPLNNANIGVAD